MSSIPVVTLIETRSGMRLFLRAVRGRWPMDPGDRVAAVARLREIAAEDRGRVSWRARQTLAELAAIASEANRPR